MGQDVSPAPTATQLDYAAPARWSRRRVSRYVVWALVLIIVAGAGWWLSAPLREQEAYLRMQRRCMTDNTPPKVVTYEEKPATSDPYNAEDGAYDGWYSHRTIGEMTIVHRRHRALGPVGAGNDAAVFLHGRRSPGGNERLVRVATHYGFETSLQSKRWVPLTYQVGTLASRVPGSRMTFNSYIPLHIQLNKGDMLRFYAGQPDPNDASHFTIGYELNDVPGTIDGWLQDDDRIKFQYRDGPATTRPTAYQF